MRRALLTLVVLAGCDSTRTVVVVRIEARPAVQEVESLEVTFSNDNATLMETFDVGGRDFPLTFSVETPDRSGALEMTARGFAEEGGLVALGGGTGTIVPDGEAGATLILEPADFPVNTDVAGSQRLAWTSGAAGVQIGAGPDGTFTIGFTDDCGELARCDLWGRRFDVEGTPLESEIEASDAQYNINRTAVFGNDPALAVAADGTLLAAWTTFEEILAVTITPSGGPGSAVETLVSTGTSPGDPTVAAVADGNYVVVWAETDAGDGERHIRARFLDENGLPAVNPVTGDASAFTVDTGGSAPSNPAVAVLDPDSEELAFLWRDGNTVKARFVTAAGQLAPAFELVLVTYDAFDDLWSPQIAATPDGAYIAAWGHRTFGGDADDGEIAARKITAPNGAAVGADFRLATGMPDAFTRFGMVGTTGPMVVTWHACEGDGDDAGCGVRAQVFRASGLPVGDAFVVNTTTDGNQTEPSIAWLGGDAFAVSWTDDSRLDPDTSETGIRARIVYPAFDQATGVLGALCDGDSPCDADLTCIAGSDEVPRCHVTCEQGGPPPQCPAGGICTRAGDVSGCIF
jgi:hypothetical protein